jgi:hypothetical protein
MRDGGDRSERTSPPSPDRTKVSRRFTCPTGGACPNRDCLPEFGEASPLRPDGGRGAGRSDPHPEGSCLPTPVVVASSEAIAIAGVEMPHRIMLCPVGSAVRTEASPFRRDIRRGSSRSDPVFVGICLPLRYWSHRATQRVGMPHRDTLGPTGVAKLGEVSTPSSSSQQSQIATVEATSFSEGIAIPVCSCVDSSERCDRGHPRWPGTSTPGVRSASSHAEPGRVFHSH